MLRRVVEPARRPWTRTRAENPVNRSAGVVDAGAKGLWYLLEGTGRARGPESESWEPPRVARRPHPPRRGERGLLVGRRLRRPVSGRASVAADRGHPRRDDEVGADCVLVVGDYSVMKVHVHTPADESSPSGRTEGRLGDVCVEDLDAMNRAARGDDGHRDRAARREHCAAVGWSRSWGSGFDYGSRARSAPRRFAAEPL